LWPFENNWSLLFYFMEGQVAVSSPLFLYNVTNNKVFISCFNHSDFVNVKSTDNLDTCLVKRANPDVLGTRKELAKLLLIYYFSFVKGTKIGNFEVKKISWTVFRLLIKSEKRLLWSKFKIYIGKCWHFFPVTSPYWIFYSHLSFYRTISYWIN